MEHSSCNVTDIPIIRKNEVVLFSLVKAANKDVFSNPTCSHLQVSNYCYNNAS